MSVIAEHKGLLFEHLSSENLGECVDVMSMVFSAGEPMTKNVGLSESEFRYFAEINCIKAKGEGLSVVARDAESKQVVGFNVCEDLATPPAKGAEEISLKFAPIMELLGKLVAVFESEYEVVPGKWMHIFMIGIRPGFRHRYLATDLVTFSVNLAKEKGYEGALGESTSYLAVRNAKRCGFEERASIYYDEYTFDGKKVFEELGHTSCRLMVRKFDQDTSSS